ncbi:prevent-host-death protein [Luteibacter jiangsuensis]|uniref:Prevent-host-death protein n=1 Tax=Luteibacter jiangsuensis TaxID=637577 RepID=A0ABX0Q2Q5_9GAMM|nr:YlcI/YnfO family protein [Luteibacter jiangsuensis]NID04794.1 prevent-host-death protein [Luteibacter jiangsuensis]
MKTATFPSIRIEPEFRQRAEAVLGQEETLSAFIETAVAEAVERRAMQKEFLARGLASLAQAERTGSYHAAADVHKEAAARVAAARKTKGEG